MREFGNSDAECQREFAGWKAAFRQALGARHAVNRMQSVGSTAPAQVASQLAAGKKRLG
jgi:hypothetical protein